MISLLLACAEPYVVPEGATTPQWGEPMDVWPDPLVRPDPTLDFDQAWHDALPEGFTLVEALEELDGYGTSGAVIFRFSAPVDLDTLVVQADFAWQLDTTDEGETLLLTPLFPLEPGTVHRVWVEAGLLDEGGEPVVANEALHAALNPPIEGFEDIPPDAVAATCFRTQSLFEEEADVLAQIEAEPPSLGAWACEEVGELERCEGLLDALDFVGDDREAFTSPAVRYEVPVSLYRPLDADTLGPVLIYGHGLGGDRGEAHRVARYLGPLGLSVAAVDAPRHADHPSTTDSADLFWILQFFGVEPSQGSFHVQQLRDNWRAAAWDKVQLARALREQGASEVLYAGHSLGGIMGAQLLAMDPEISAAELRVPGGRVSEIVHRGETFAPLIALMAPSGTTQGEVDRFFPMLQAAIERGDAVNHATRVERDLLLTLVEDDTIIPNATTEVLARGFGLEVAPPGAIEGLDPSPSLPSAGNLDGRTAIAFRYAEHFDDDSDSWVPATHSDTFSSPTGQAQSAAFWASKLEGGAPEVIDPID